MFLGFCVYICKQQSHDYAIIFIKDICYLFFVSCLASAKYHLHFSAWGMLVRQKEVCETSAPCYNNNVGNDGIQYLV